MPGILSEYITEPPPFAAGLTALDKAISDIWAKRKQDEDLRREAAQQLVDEGQLGVNRLIQAETGRHNVAAEAHDRGTLERDRAKDQLAYLADVAKAYQEGRRGYAGQMGAQAGLLGLPAQAGAAPVVPDGGGAGSSYTADGYLRGAEPGTIIEPATPSTEGPTPGSGRIGGDFTQADADQTNREHAAGAPPGNPYARALEASQAAGAAPAPAQAELNTQKPAAPPQPAGDPSAPAGAPAAPPQAAALGGQVRREDIHNQPKPASQLGAEAPVAPGTPAELPAMPYAGDPKKHPIALGAEPGRDADVPTGPGAVPTPGPGYGAPPGGLDPATQRQWLQRGVVGQGAGVIDGEAIMRGNAEVAQQAMGLMRGYAQDDYEVSLAQNAAEAVAQASQLMPVNDAYKQVSAQFFKALHEHRQDQRTDTSATAQAGRFDAVQKRIQAQNDAQNEFHRQEAAARAERDRARVERDRLKAEALAGHHQNEREDAQTKDFLSRQATILAHRGIVRDKAAADTVQQLEHILEDPSSVDKEIAKRLVLVLGNNKGSTSNEDATASEGLPSRSLEKKWSDLLDAAIEGKTPNATNDLRDSVAKLKQVLLARTLRLYRADRDSIIANAPNDYARRQALADLRREHLNFGWALGEFYLEDHPEARPGGAAASGSPKPQTAPAPPAPSKPKSKGKKAKPKATSEEKRLDDEVDEMLDNGVHITPKGR